MSYNSHFTFQSILCPGAIILTSGTSVILTALPYHYGLRPSFQPVQITLSGMAFLHGLYIFCALSAIGKAHRSIVEVLLYALVCFICFAAAVPMVVRWRTDDLSEDYDKMTNKSAVIAFSIVMQCAAAITSLLGLVVSAFNRMEIKERDLSILDEESSFWNSARSRQSSVRDTPNVGTRSNSPPINSLHEKNQDKATMGRDIGVLRLDNMIGKDPKIKTRHSC